MIQLVMLFIFVIFVICIILLYKKYIKIKNIVDKEQDKKYSKVKGAIDTNNIKIKNMKKKVKDIINNKENDPSLLDSRVDINKKQISSNRNTIIDNNFETINSVFKYDNGLFIGGTAGHMKINDNNIKLNVQNPAKVRVCNSNNKCSNIITNKIVQNTFPEIISNTTSQQQQVEAAGSMHQSGISGSSWQQPGSSLQQVEAAGSMHQSGISGSSWQQPGSSLQQVEEQVHDNNILVSEDNNFQFDNNTKVLSIESGISIMGVEEKNENEITKHSDCNLDKLGVNRLILDSILKPSYCTGNLLSNIDNTKNYSFKITEKILTGGKNIYEIDLISDGSKIVEIINNSSLQSGSSWQQPGSSWLQSGSSLPQSGSMHLSGISGSSLQQPGSSLPQSGSMHQTGISGSSWQQPGSSLPQSGSINPTTSGTITDTGSIPELVQIAGGDVGLSGIVVASNTHTAKFGPEKLFDNKVDLSASGGGGWHNRYKQYPLSTNPVYLRITFNEPQEVIQMKMLAREGLAVQGPKNYQIFGTNKEFSSSTDFSFDGTGEVLLLDKVNTPLTSGSYSDNIAQNQINHPTLTITDNFTKTGLFKNYIIKITESYTVDAVSIMELFLFTNKNIIQPLLVSDDNNFQFDNNTKVLSIKSDISIMGVEEKNENEITKHSDCNLDKLGVNRLILDSILKPSYCTGNLLSILDNTKNYSFKITEKILTGGKNIYDIGLISDGSKIVEIRNILI